MRKRHWSSCGFRRACSNIQCSNVSCGMMLTLIVCIILAVKIVEKVLSG